MDRTKEIQKIRKRKQLRKDLSRIKKEEKLFSLTEKQLKSNTAGELKDVMRYIKENHPESTRKQRQEVAARYRKQCNNC